MQRLPLSPSSYLYLKNITKVFLTILCFCKKKLLVCNTVKLCNFDIYDTRSTVSSVPEPLCWLIIYKEPFRTNTGAHCFNRMVN